MNISSSSRGVDREGTVARVIWIPLVVVLAASLAGFGLVWSVRGELPDPVARHWGADGRPDGFGSLNSQLVFGLLFCLGMPLLMFGLGAGMRQLRAMGPVTAGLAVFLSALFFGGLYAQRGLDSATAASASWPMWFGFTRDRWSGCWSGWPSGTPPLMWRPRGRGRGRLASALPPEPGWPGPAPPALGVRHWWGRSWDWSRPW